MKYLQCKYFWVRKYRIILYSIHFFLLQQIKNLFCFFILVGLGYRYVPKKLFAHGGVAAYFTHHLLGHTKAKHSGNGCTPHSVGGYKVAHTQGIIFFGYRFYFFSRALLFRSEERRVGKEC